jgi:hypothetical protein
MESLVINSYEEVGISNVEALDILFPLLMYCLHPHTHSIWAAELLRTNEKSGSSNHLWDVHSIVTVPDHYGIKEPLGSEHFPREII